MEQRIEDLEVKIAFLEHQLVTLDEVVRELAGKLDAALREVKDLKDRSSTDGQQVDQRDLLHERPPHY